MRISCISKSKPVELTKIQLLMNTALHCTYVYEQFQVRLHFLHFSQSAERHHLSTMTELTNIARSYLAESIAAQQSLDINSIECAIERIVIARNNKSRIYIIGNGGSAATASHAAVDLTKTSSKIHGIPAISIALADQVPVLTAISNDSNFDSSFSEQIDWFGSEGDVLLAISASGNSPNILAAVDAAIEKGMIVVALCGFGGGQLSKKAHTSIVVDSSEYGPVEDAHMMIIHLFTRALQLTGK